MTVREYRDKFTLDGRLKPQLGVTKAKVKAAQALMERALQGDIRSDAILREAVTSTDAVLNVAHLVNLEFVPQLDKVERNWSELATVRTVADFRPAALYSIFGDLNGSGIDENGAAAVVPEGNPYPHVTISGQESMYSKLAKRGVRFDYTWEARINDAIGFFAGLPAELLGLTVDTEYAEILDALINGTSATSALAGGTLPDDTIVAPNAPLTPDALWQAIREESNREINGRKIGRATGYNVLVPVGVKDFIDFQIRRTIISITDGAITYGPGDQSALANVTTIESDRLSGNEWYLLPKPGSTRRPVLELLRLRGYETPELRVNGLTGSYVGGGSVSPFEGSFDSDVISYRYRYVAGGALWDDTYIVKSDGSGTA